MKYACISSGSEGNSTLISSGETNILVDCGITKKKLTERLNQVNCSINELDRLLITHTHSDHVKGIKFIQEDKWMSRVDVLGQPLNEEQYFYPYKTFKIKDISVTPLPLSHDAKDTTGFLFDDGKESLVYITDTGYIKEKVMKLISDKTYYIFESNHDAKMLYESDRSAYLISRIHSDIGHLDNIESATYLSSLIGKDTKEVTLAHLSEECNTPELALESFQKVMVAQLGYLPHVLLRCASIENLLTGGDHLKK